MPYTIKRVPRLAPAAADWSAPQWQQAETLQVARFPWADSGHHPRTQARLLYDDQHLAAAFHVDDQYVRAVARKFQDSVCTDSCAEFFVAPVPGSDAYFNFEVNCGGTMLVFRCVSAEERAAGRETQPLSDDDGATIAMAHTLPQIVEPELTEPTAWTIEYHVPFALFAAHFGIAAPGPGATWRANFYKCADHTSHPHWGSWAPVDTPRPNFHVPASFQPIVFA